MQFVPRVSIGIPIFNGAKTIADTLDSLLAQTYTDFEIVVSDNASTDNSVTIVTAYQKRDSRIRLIKQQKNIGANGNFSAVVDAARGEYFKWATCSDLCSTNFLEACVRMLDQSPEVVLAAPRTRLFTTHPSEASEYDGDIEVRKPTAIARFLELIETLKLNNAMNGLIRIKDLRCRHPVIDHFMKADIVMVSCLAMQGQFAIARDAIFLRRMDPCTSTSLMNPEDDMKHHYPVMTRKALFPTWRLYLGWWRAIRQTPISGSDKRRAMLHVLKMCRWEQREMFEDLVNGLNYFMRLRWLGRDN